VNVDGVWPLGARSQSYRGRLEAGVYSGGPPGKKCISASECSAESATSVATLRNDSALELQTTWKNWPTEKQKRTKCGGEPRSKHREQVLLKYRNGCP
jgi:hypothetical protein